MTIALEHIQDGDWAAVNRVVDALRSLVPDTGGRSLGIRIGSVQLTFTASATSATVNVSHGLGRAPVGVFYGAQDINVLATVTTAPTATTFTAQARAVSAVTGTITVYWLAVG